MRVGDAEGDARMLSMMVSIFADLRAFPRFSSLLHH